MIRKGLKETFWDNGYVDYFDSGDGFTGIYIDQNLSNYTFLIHAVEWKLITPQ